MTGAHDLSNYALTAATEGHLRAMMSWFPSSQSCALWGGPGFRFPFTDETFIADAKFRQLASYALIDEVGAFCAFGQFYPRVNRCHLGRLAVDPALRGRRLGTRLIQVLSREGSQKLGLAEISLFVSIDNPAALALYERLGFLKAPYPEPNQNLPRSFYMIAPLATLDSTINNLN